MNRPHFDAIYMNLALMLAKRSTCSRAHVGCVIATVDNQRVLAVGYNGGAKGVFNDCLSIEPGQCGHAHSETNALVKCNYNVPTLKKMYVTMSPCFACSVLIVNAGVSEVIYLHEYRKTEGTELLKKAGVTVRQLSERDIQIDEDAQV